MTYDHWKTTTPADELLGPEPMRQPLPRRQVEYSPQEYRERRGYAAGQALTEAERREWDLP
jgi:hypothetical protein